MRNDRPVSRRDLLKGAVAGTALAALARFLPQEVLAAIESQATSGNTAAGKRPNIVLILADDMGFSDAGCYGGEIQTPNIDRLATTGLRFTQIYNNSRCCPTRASLQTGLYPHSVGVGHMTKPPHPQAPYQGHLNEQCVTLGEVLKTAGYTTMMSGKWHIGEERPHWPCDRGYEHSEVLIGGYSSYWKPAYLVRDDAKITTFEDDFYITDHFSQRACDMLGQYGHGDKPFFLYLAYNAPHFPLHARPADIAKYMDLYRAGYEKVRQDRYQKQLEMGIIDKTWKMSELDTRPWEELSDDDREDKILRMAVYAAQIDRMDQGIGQVMDKLKEIGQDGNTIVIFLSDNGGCAEVVDTKNPKGLKAGEVGSWLSYGQSWANASNTPLRKFKHWTHEGGISTPFIVNWPGVVKNGGAINATEVGHVIDIMPTFLEVAGAKYPGELDGKKPLPLEGASLVPAFEGKARRGPDAYYWEHEGNRAVRHGKWKLVGRYQKPWELYDIVADRTELNDLAGAQGEKVKTMAAMYDAWAKRCGVLPWAEVDNVYVTTAPAKAASAKAEE